MNTSLSGDGAESNAAGPCPAHGDGRPGGRPSQSSGSQGHTVFQNCQATLPQLRTLIPACSLGSP